MWLSSLMRSCSTCAIVVHELEDLPRHALPHLALADEGALVDADVPDATAPVLSASAPGTSIVTIWQPGM